MERGSSTIRSGRNSGKGCGTIRGAAVGLLLLGWWRRREAWDRLRVCETDFGTGGGAANCGHVADCTEVPHIFWVSVEVTKG